MAKPVRFGVFVPQGWRMDLTEIAAPTAKFDAMLAAARAADAEPTLDSIWVYDHFLTRPTPTLETVFECWVSSAALARETRRVNIGQLVSCNGYRHPALFAKMASTLDAASGGREIAGIGAGWAEHEFHAYGYAFPDTPQRMRAFREAVELIHRMWTESYPTFAGRAYTIDGAINEPKGAHGPPPLWIGGDGERVTLRLVAQYGDGCNVGDGDLAVIPRKLAALRRHCDDLGRDYDAIAKSTIVNTLVLEPGEDRAAAIDAARGHRSPERFRELFWVGAPEELAERFQALRETGIDYLIAYLPRLAYDHTQLQRFAREVAPLLR
ncbi:MAG: TIGR03560 family F420-dependent LLM class oxidoreductase [Thermomicrobiales bacterium]|nr:TIGR03560 family F420-dependent LLM class oxidoreductase [Thermomicrobiales bacterium]